MPRCNEFGFVMLSQREREVEAGLPTQRQLEYLRHRANGLSRKQIAHEMGIEVSTLVDIIAGANARLQAINSHHAVAIALRRKLIR